LPASSPDVDGRKAIVNPEFPFLAAGAVTIVGGAIREKRWPSNSTKAIIGTVTLVIVASATGNTKVAPLVQAIGLLFLLAAVLATVKAVNKSKKGK
jgi:peptidoglycan/LPS O-acetylase OafA/YrhL